VLDRSALWTGYPRGTPSGTSGAPLLLPRFLFKGTPLGPVRKPSGHPDRQYVPARTARHTPTSSTADKAYHARRTLGLAARTRHRPPARRPGIEGRERRAASPDGKIERSSWLFAPPPHPGRTRRAATSSPSSSSQPLTSPRTHHVDSSRTSSNMSQYSAPPVILSSTSGPRPAGSVWADARERVRYTTCCTRSAGPRVAPPLSRETRTALTPLCRPFD